MSALGVIGSAGRRDDAERMTGALFEVMLEETKSLIELLAIEHVKIDCLVSGGAAWADQCAVTLFLLKHVPRLELCLPAPFNSKTSVFVETHGRRTDPGRILNYYHLRFSEKVGFNSRHALGWALETPGCHVEMAPGFKERNALVAAKADILLAMTFGEGPRVKPGGTADTVARFLAKPGPGAAYHLDLGRELCYANARVGDAGWKEMKATRSRLR